MEAEYAEALSRMTTGAAQDSLLEFFDRLREAFSAMERRDLQEVLNHPIEYAAERLLGKYFEE